MTRREFLASSAAATAASAATGSVRFAARPFDLGRVRLNKGPFLEAAELNRRYMAGLSPDRLLHAFRVTAGLPSNAEPLGGWEAPVNELRGHFTGHYLTACALRSAAFGDDEMKARGNAMVAELAKCQKALGSGYLSAFPEELFDRLRAGVRVWAPFYTIHKIMAGMLDMAALSKNEQALEVVNGMAAWTNRWTQPLGEGHMARVLEIEYGGMNEVLYNLHAVSGNREHLRLARRFDHERIFAPLAEGRDELKGLHVNTQIPKIIGAARRYELTGETRYRDISEYFWRQVTGKRSYCTGGTSNGERWNSDPGKLAKELSAYTQECCCTYNMLKLTRTLFGWTADAELADYYERALFNGILGTQHPADGMTMYYVPLASGYWKLFGLPLEAFWCCTGSGIESFSKLADSIYFHDADGIWVNLFVASELDWPDKKVRLVQETRFPDEDTATFTVGCDRPARMALRVRVPYWTGRGAGLRLNGRPLETFAAPGGYVVIDREWQDKDKLEIKLPMTLDICPMPDDPTLQAILYGPLVMAGELGDGPAPESKLRAAPTKPRDIPHYIGKPVAAPSFKAPEGNLASWIKPAGGPLRFRTAGQARDVDLVPLYRIFDRHYGVYWKME